MKKVFFILGYSLKSRLATFQVLNSHCLWPVATTLDSTTLEHVYDVNFDQCSALLL